MAKEIEKDFRVLVLSMKAVETDPELTIYEIVERRLDPLSYHSPRGFTRGMSYQEKRQRQHIDQITHLELFEAASKCH